jgi:Zn-dependent membrane protease YugP
MGYGYGYYGIDLTYLIFVVPALLVSLYAQFKVQNTFSRYSQERCVSGLTGAETAYRILQANGITDIRIEHIQGNLTDHYSPTEKVIRLSDSVYNVPSIAAVGVAAHECGHAIQYATGYAPIKLRNAIIPASRIGSALSFPLLLIGLLMNFQPLVLAGIGLFSLVTIFQLLTLPVEFDASHRALNVIDERGMLTREEYDGAKKVLSAAALTYVAALLVSLGQLLRFLLLFGRRRN